MKRRKGLAFILALSLVLSSFSVAFATDVAEETTSVTETTTEAVAPVATATNTAFADIAGHWAKDAIVKWADYGVVKGSDGVFRPDAPLTRAEMATVLSNLMDYKVAAKNNFSDVATGAWYADAVLKANAAGVLSGDGSGLASPSANITREQAASMLARAFAVADANGTSSSLTDTQNISSWARPAVFGMEAAGYVRGFEGKFNPKNNITRAEVITIINNAVKAYYTAAGTYTENVDGLAVVKVPGVVLKDVVISGNLIAAEGIASGDLTLDGKTEVKGKLIVRGGGENSIIIKGSAAVLSIEVSKVDGKVRIFADGALIKEITALKGEIILEGNFTNVEVKADATVIIKGNVGTLSMESKGTVDIQSGTVTTLDIPAGATATVAANATVTTANITGAADIKGTGAIGTANISGTGATIVQTPTAVNVADGGAATVGGKTVDGATSAAPSTGGGRGNSSNTVAVSAININKSTTTLVQGTTETLTATFTPSNASNKTITWTTSDASKATIDSTGKVRAVSAGTATITAKSNNGKTATCVVTVTTTVVPVSAISVSPGTLTLTAGGATGTLTATVSPAGATNKNVTWASSNTSVATVAGGVVTPLTAGTTTITATTVDGGFSEKTSVTVAAAEDYEFIVFEVDGKTIGVILKYEGSETNIVIPAKIGGVDVQGIGQDAFADKNLTSVVIPNSVTMIASGSFNNNQLPDEQAFIYRRNTDGSEDKTILVSYGGAKRDGVTIPNSVTKIEEDAFSEIGLVSINIPDSVTTINAYSFDDNKLTEITIPNSVTSIKENAFANNGPNSNSGSIPESDFVGTWEIVGEATEWTKKDASVVPVSAITVSPTTMELTVGGGTKTITATVSPAGATNKTVTWTSSNNAVATVANGVVTPVTVGTTTITATTVDGGFAKTISVTVTAAPVTLNSIAITTPATKTIYTVGETLDITGLVVTGTYSDSSTKVETITAANVSGFDSSTILASQTLTVTVGGKTATYTVEIRALEKVATPVITTSKTNVTNREAGVTFSVGPVAGVSYYYTLDGNTPTSSSTPYSTEVILTAPENDAVATINIKVIGIKTGLTDSDVATATVTYAAKDAVTYLATVNGGTGGGNFAGGETVSITAGTATSGKEFDKWTTSDGVTFANANSATTTFIMSANPVAVTATYKDIDYAINYVLNSGTNGASNPGTYTIETETITLADATRADYIFDGWYKEAGFTNKVTQIAKGSTGNMTLYAKWSAAPVLGTLSPTVTPGDGKVVLSAMTAEAGYKFYYKKTAVSDVANKPALDSIYSTGWTVFTSNTDITGTNGTSIFVQVIKVATDGNKIKAWGEASATPANVPVTGVTLDQATMNLKIGAGTGTLKATIVPANASNKDVTWSSSATAVATVDNTGKVTPVAAGTATITVTTADGSKTATCIVTVTAANIATSVIVNGEKILQSGLPYLVYGERAASGTLGSDGCTAYFDLATGILTLHNYDGAYIDAVSLEAKDLIIKLIGTNKVTGTTTGIQNPGDGDIYITADSDATLEVITSASQDSYAISSQYDSSGTKGSVVIGGKAKVTVSATSDTKQAIGIFAREGVSIQEDAYFTAAINAKVEMDGYGILAKKSLTINTTGDISIDCSQSQKGVCLYSTLDLNHVNLMTLKAPTSGGFIFGSPDLSGVAVNINTTAKVASYRSGTAYNLEVLNGVIDSTSVLGGVSDSSGTHQALENDEIIIKADTIDLFTFDKWTNEDGSELSPSIFTMVNAATGEAKIKMPAGNLNIKANYKSMLFTEQPQFHRGDMKITWNIKSAANSGSLQRKTVETWSDWKTIDIAIGAGTRSINNSSGDTTKYAPDGTYRLKFVLNSGDAGFQEHYSDEFEILWDAQLEGTVAITGTPMFGETLTANATITSTEPGELKYQWFADTDEISGATNQTLMLAEEQIGKTIKVEVSSHNYNLPITKEAGPVTKATAPAAPIVVGTASTPADEILVVGGVERIIVTIGANMTGVYEYSVDSGSIWSQLAAGYINGLTSATTSIQIRVKETTTTETGAVATQAVTVTDMIVVADKTVLTTAISEANTNKGTAVVSTDGSDVLPANKWVTLAEMTAYTTAIATAQGVAENTSATQTEVNSAVTVLATATSTFDTAKKAGTKVALDTTPPVITATDKIVPIANLAAWTETVSATDDVNGNITSNVVATYFQSDGSTSLTDLAAAKTYIGDASVNTSFIIKYNVKDTADNAATEVTVTITVTKANVPDSISVGGQTLNSTNPYLVEGTPATTGTLGAGNCTAYFDPITGDLSLQGYDGETIKNMTSGKDLSIKLIGNNNKITGGQFGIYNYSGDIHITSDSEASLEINQNGSSDSATIVTGWGGFGTGSVIISGKAKVKALGITTNGFMNGIQARKDVTIQNEASFDATLKATSNTAWGIYANNIIIDTVGNIDINFSNSTKGYGIYATGKMEIKHVNSMLITLPLTGVASTTNFTTGTVDVSSGVAVNKSTTKASYRSGTPYTLGLEGGNITSATGGVIGSPNHQYLVDDEITIQSTISESNFDRWTKADGTELIGSLFIDSTTANSATATIKMPAESLSIKAKEKDAKISIAAIPGVIAPVTGATPVTTPIETAQYTGTVVWSPTDATFKASTVYTATITLVPKTGFKLEGVNANYFTVDGSTATHAVDSGVVTAVFPKTTALSSDATLISSIGTVDNDANTIVDIPNATTLAVFKAAITPATGATFKVYQADGTTEATYLASGYKVIVTAQDTTTTKTYTVTVEIGDFAGGLGTVGSPYQVSNAEQLNKVRDYMGQNVYFTQTADINLTSYLASDGAGYNGGKGWVPIGSSETGSEFKGNYDGANYTITGLTIVSSEDYQGLFGNGAQDTNLKNIKLSGVNIKGNSYVGGLIGKFGFGQLENCHVSGKVEGTGDFVGGLAGLYNNSEIGEGMKNCSTSVEVIGNKHVGGLAGYSGYTTIDSCYSKGSVKGVENVGGLVGYMSSTERVKVSNSYSLASVTGTGTGNKPVGGLVGYNNKAIENCYAVGLVTGTGTGTYVGGLVGTNASTVTSSYYDSTTTTQSDTGKGVGKITTDMKQAATFAGWDTSIWNIADGSYPTLKWQE